MRKYSIVIPTRDRSETLEWTLRSCLAIRYPDLEIIVSDNCSEDRTREVVEGLQDGRIRYYRTPGKLGMSANWEFGLEKVREGMVSILGDDDAFMPDSLDLIDRLLDEHGTDAISWKQSFYRWPSNDFVRIKNLLTIPLKQGAEVRNGLSELGKLLRLERLPAELPWLYGGFVDIRHVEKLKSLSGGKFFLSKIPDIYSAVALSTSVREYVYSYSPFSMAGHSSKSNGSAQIRPTEEVADQNDQFIRDSESHPFHPALEFVHVYPVLIWETFLQAADRKLIPDGVMPDPQFLMDESVKDCIRLGFLENSMDKLRSIAAKNDLHISMPSSGSLMRVSKLANDFKSYLKIWTGNKFIKCDEYGIQNIYDAAVAYRSLEAGAGSRPGVIFDNIKLLLKSV